MLFVGNRDGEPLSSARAADLMRGVEAEEIPRLVQELNDRYATDGCPYHVIKEGSGYRLALRKAYHSVRNRFYGRVREARLSQAAIDVLAIVAYRQPLTAEEIARLRGKPSGHVLAQLVRRGLLRIQRKQAKRKMAQYFTTDRFLKLFSLDSLDDLPRSEDLDRQ
jgi:segregation and condensation protein B